MLKGQLNEQHKSDFQRLIHLCGSYGLNQQQTKQIISDFQNGSFNYTQGNSIDDSFQQSIKGMISDRELEPQQQIRNTNRLEMIPKQQIQGDDEYLDNRHFQDRPESSRHNEEYSFKNYQYNDSGSFCFNSGPKLSLKSGSNTNRNRTHHQKNFDSLEEDPKQSQNQEHQNYNKHEQSYRNQNKNHQSHQSKYQQHHHQSSFINSEILQSVLTPILSNFQSYHRQLSDHLAYNNQILGRQLQQKQQQIQMLTRLKLQDAELINSLKQSLTILTQQLRQKDRLYKIATQNNDKKQIQLKQCKSQLKQYKCQLLKYQDSHTRSINSQYNSNHTQSQFNITNQLQQQLSSQNYKDLHLKSYNNVQNNVNYLNQNNEPLKYTKNKSIKKSDIQIPAPQRQKTPLRKSITGNGSQKQMNPLSSKQNLHKAKSQSMIHPPPDRKKAHEEKIYGKYPQNNPKRTGVDINKYKGMIQKLRSSYQIR